MLPQLPSHVDYLSVRRSQAVDDYVIVQLFTEARTHNAFRDFPVSDALLWKALDLEDGSDIGEQQPLRVVFLR